MAATFLENKINELESKGFQVEFDYLTFQDRNQNNTILIWEKISSWNLFLDKIEQIKLNNSKKTIIWIYKNDMVAWVQENETKS